MVSVGHFKAIPIKFGHFGALYGYFVILEENKLTIWQFAAKPRLLYHFWPKYAKYVINELKKLSIGHFWANLGSYAIFLAN